MTRLVVVSNRVAVPEPGARAAAGGLAVALREAFEQRGGLWFGWSGRVAEQPAATPRIVDRGRVQYALVDLSRQEHREYYSGFANRALWPNMHYRVGLTEFSRADYAGYQRVNRAFAGALAQLIEPSDLVWVHDYHLIPLATELRAAGVGNPIGYFHHIPWPAPEVFGTLPGSRELLRSVVDYDLVGLQTEDDADNLRRSLVREVAARRAGRDMIEADGRRSTIRSFPIGIDAGPFRRAAERGGTNRVVSDTIRSIGSRKLIIGVDRLDYSKGIPERLEAVERFFASNPDQRGRAVYLQIAPKSRTEVPEYVALSRTVNETLGRVNGALSEPGWAPIQYVSKSYPRSVLAGLCRVARVGLVTPMRDGMNLVAKEYVAAQDPADPGVLILSRFAGAAQQLTEALLVNPFDKFEIAEALRDALYMDESERIARWRSMITSVVEQDVSWWASSYLASLSAAGRGSARRPVEAAE